MMQSLKKYQKILLLSLSFLVVFMSLEVSLFTVRSSNDVWWHLKTGKVLCQTKALPETDIFTIKGHEYEWVNHEWLCEVGMYLVYQLGGRSVKAVNIAKGILVAALYLMLFLFVLRETKNGLLAAVVSLFALWGSRHTMYIRPPMVTFFFFCLYFYLFDCASRAKLSKNWKWFSVILMVLWTNLHGGAILAIVLFGFYFIHRVFLTFRAQRSWFFLTPDIWWGLGLMVAICMNPWGYKTVMLTFKVMGDSMLPRVIFELQPPEWKYLPQIIVFFCGAFPLIFAGWVLRWKNEKSINLFTILLQLFLIYEAFNAVRHLPLLCTVTALNAAMAMAYLSRSFPPYAKKILAIVLLVILGSQVYLIDQYHRPIYKEFLQNKAGYFPDNYPEKVVSFIRLNRIPGPFFNDENFSGYLIWGLSPEYAKIFTDVRFDIFTSDFLPYSFSVKEGYREKDLNLPDTLDLFGVNGVILNLSAASAKGVEYLEELPDWIKIYQDHGFVLFIRNNEQNKSLVDKFGNV